MLDLKPGDSFRLTRAFTLTAQNPPLTDIEIKLGAGQLMTITRLQGEEIFATVQFGSNMLEVVIMVAFSADGIQDGSIEILQPVEEPLVGATVESSVEPDPGSIPEPPKPETASVVVKPESMVNSCQHNRYSIATIRATTKRPEVFLYQGALKAIDQYSGAVDGWYGKGSAEAVEAFQQQNKLEPDGVIGQGTATELIQQATAAGFEPDLKLRIMSIIAFYEVSTRRNAFGMAGDDIGDAAGANYGISQCNSLGSVVTMLKLAGRSDLVSIYSSVTKKTVNPAIQDWFGSAEGIATQVRYFEDKTLKQAMQELREFALFDAWEHDPAMQVQWGRAVLLFCDSVIQNGTMWSNRRRPFWKNLVGVDRYKRYQNIPELFYGIWWDKMLGQYCSYQDFKKAWWAENERQLKLTDDSKKARCATTKAVAAQFVQSIPVLDPQAKLVVLAQIRARSSWEKYWHQAVASRRITDATGSSANHPDGVVNDATIDLACGFQL